MRSRDAQALAEFPRPTLKPSSARAAPVPFLQTVARSAPFANEKGIQILAMCDLRRLRHAETCRTRNCFTG